MNDKDYDRFITATPWDNEPDIEVFKAENYEYYSTNEDDIRSFEDGMAKVQYHVIQPEYSDRSEYLEECEYNLVDELGLHKDEFEAIEAYGEFLQGQYEDYQEAKSEWIKESRRIENE